MTKFITQKRYHRSHSSLGNGLKSVFPDAEASVRPATTLFLVLYIYEQLRGGIFLVHGSFS